MLLIGLWLALLLLPLWTLGRVREIARRLETLESRLSHLERAGSGASVALAAADAALPEPPALHAPETSLAADVLARPDEPPCGTPTAAAPLESRPSARGETLGLEERLGGRALLYTGVLILLLGVSFFLKYAFDNEWVGPQARIALGLITGIALSLVGVTLGKRRLEVFGRALSGTGFAVLYLTVYGATELYGLLAQSTAFALMVVVTGSAAWVADRERAQSLAFVAVGGGFLTPFLVGGPSDAQALLFGYEALLVAGTWSLARRHAWIGLNALTYILTVATWGLWSARHYSGEKWLTTLLYMSLFCALFVGILRETWRVPGSAARLISGLLWTAPALYHLAAVGLTSEHAPAFHVYVILFTLAGLLLTGAPARPWLRVVLLLMAVAPLFGYLLLPEGPGWLVANLVAVVAVCGLHLLTLFERLRREGPLRTGELLTVHLAGLALFGLLHRTLEPVYPHVRGMVAIGVASLATMLWLLFRRRDSLAGLNALALAFTLIAIAVTLQFDGRPVVVGWAAEGAAVAWLGLRVPSRAFRVGGMLLWAAAALRLTDGYFDTPVGFTAVVNERSLATMVVVALGYFSAWRLHRLARHIAWADATRTALHVGCSVLTLLWISGEIRSYWDVRYETPQAYLSEQLFLSLGWGLYGAAAIATGMWWRYAPLRYIGMGVIGVTVLKVFLVDLWDLGGIYRVVGFLSLGVLLVLVSYLYQRRNTESSHTAV